MKETFSYSITWRIVVGRRRVRGAARDDARQADPAEPAAADEPLEAVVEAAVDDEVHDTIEDEQQVVDRRGAHEPHGRPAAHGLIELFTYRMSIFCLPCVGNMPIIFVS